MFAGMAASKLKEGMLTGDSRMEEQIQAYKRKGHDLCRDRAV